MRLLSLMSTNEGKTCEKCGPTDLKSPEQPSNIYSGLSHDALSTVEGLYQYNFRAIWISRGA